MVRVSKQLYERGADKDSPPIINSRAKLFSSENIKEGIKKLAISKSRDTDGLQAEHLKWGLEALTTHIKKNIQ